MKAFYKFEVAEVRDDFTVKYAEVLGDDGSKRYFSIVVTNSAPLYIGIEFYTPRMYPINCKTGWTSATAEL